MEHGCMDLIHRRAHPDGSLRRFHVLLLQSQPELKIRCVPSLIYPVYLYIPIFQYSPIHLFYNRNNCTSYEDVESWAEGDVRPGGQGSVAEQLRAKTQSQRVGALLASLEHDGGHLAFSGWNLSAAEIRRKKSYFLQEINRTLKIQSCSGIR